MRNYNACGHRIIYMTVSHMCLWGFENDDFVLLLGAPAAFDPTKSAATVYTCMQLSWLLSFVCTHVCMPTYSNIFYLRQRERGRERYSQTHICVGSVSTLIFILSLSFHYILFIYTSSNIHTHIYSLLPHSYSCWEFIVGHEASRCCRRCPSFTIQFELYDGTGITCLHTAPIFSFSIKKNKMITVVDEK